MKKYESDSYDTLAVNGHSRLVVKGDTLEGTRAEIDRANEMAIAQGYKSESWIITHREYYSWYDDNNVFVKSESLEQAIEIYPPMS